MTIKPTISVIISTYNQAHFLKDCLSSLRNQTFSNWEAILVNNFSTDHTIEVIQSFHDSRFKLVNFHNYGVLGLAKNEGVRHARGEFIAFLDSDDLWEPRKLEEVFNVFEKNPTIDLICHDVSILYNSGRRRFKKVGPYTQYKDLLLKGNVLCVSAVSLRKAAFEKVGGFSEDKNIVSAEDYDLWMRLAKENHQFYFLPKVLGTIRKHEHNFSANIETHCQKHLQVLDLHFEQYPHKNIYYQYLKRKRYAKVFYGTGRDWLAKKQFLKARQYLYQSLKYDPVNWKAWVSLLLT